MNNEILNTAREKVKKYYQGLNEIEKLKIKLDNLKKQKTDIIYKLNNDEVHLNDCTKGINYSKENVKSGTSVLSPQEQELENAYNRLEKQLERIEADIINTEIKIRDIENSNYDIGYIINKLNEDSKTLLYEIYIKKKQCWKIAMDSNMDKSTVVRKHYKILEDISKWICFYF